MPEQGSAKWISNEMRKKQRTKIRWYCGLCHVACKDENGYKNHIESAPHLRREMTVGDSGKEFSLVKDDKNFQKKFINHMISKHFGQTVLAHEAYRDLYPLDRGHNVMKGTCWGTLGVFVAHLRRCGLIDAQKGIKGWQIRVSNDLHLGSDLEEESSADDSGSEDEVVDQAKPFKKIRIAKTEIPIEQHSTATSRTDTTKVSFNLGFKGLTKVTSANAPAAFAEVDSDG